MIKINIKGVENRKCESCHSCTRHSTSLYSIIQSSIIKIVQIVSELETEKLIYKKGYLENKKKSESLHSCT